LNAVSHRSGVDTNGERKGAAFLSGGHQQPELSDAGQRDWHLVAADHRESYLRAHEGRVLSDEITFGEWKSELSAADGKVLAEVPKYVKEYDSNWEPEVAKYPVPFKVEGTPLKARDVVVGLQIDGPGRAYSWDALVKQSPVEDHVHGVPLLVAVGPDGKSFRVFISRIDGKDAEFFFEERGRGGG